MLLFEILNKLNWKNSTQEFKYIVTHLTIQTKIVIPFINL